MSPTTKRTATRSSTRGARDLTRAILDPKLPAKARVAAVTDATALAVTRATVMEALFTTVRNTGDPVTLRRAALNALDANSFRTNLFAAYLPQYLEALRTIADDHDLQLRHSALEVLAAHGDDYGRRLLVDGLRDPATALLDPATALGIVGSDIHAQDVRLVRKLASSDDTAVRRSALRVLAADGGSAAFFRKIVRDKTDDREARATSAIALQSINPDSFRRLAHAVALDDDDYPEIRTTVLNALAHDDTATTSPRVRKQLDELTSAPAPVRAAARRLLDRDAER